MVGGQGMKGYREMNRLFGAGGSIPYDIVIFKKTHVLSLCHKTYVSARVKEERQMREREREAFVKR